MSDDWDKGKDWDKGNSWDKKSPVKDAKIGDHKTAGDPHKHLEWRDQGKWRNKNKPWDPNRYDKK